MQLKNAIGKLLAEVESSLRMLKIALPERFDVKIHVENGVLGVHEATYTIVTQVKTSDEYMDVLNAFELKSNVSDKAEKSTSTDTFKLSENGELEIWIPSDEANMRFDAQRAKEQLCKHLNVTICPELSMMQVAAKKDEISKFLNSI